MSIISKIASIVACFAIAIGSIAKFAPYLFFKVPNIGFILYAITGGSPTVCTRKQRMAKTK